MNSSSQRKAAVKKLKNLFFTAKSEVKDYRKKFDSTFENPLLSNNVEFFERNYASVVCDVLSPEIYSTNRIILYIHGGCFIGGSKKAYRPFAASLASALSSRAVIPEFRLAPTHPFPASLEDVQSVFKTMYTEELIAGSLESTDKKSVPQIIIMADGSGASVALALVLSLNEKFRSAVKQIVLFSPWLDVSVDSKKFTIKKNGDELFTADAMRRCAELYTFQNNRNIPLVSPLKASKEMLKGFPPVYIQSGEKDFLLEDAELFERLLMDCGVKCTLDVWQNMPAMFELADEFFEESHLAIEKIGKLFTSQKTDEKESSLEIQLELEKSGS